MLPAVKPSGLRPIYRFEIPTQTDKKKKKNKKGSEENGKAHSSISFIYH